MKKFIELKDIEGLKNLLLTTDTDTKGRISSYIRSSCTWNILDQKESFLNFFKELIKEGIVLADKDFYLDLIAGFNYEEINSVLSVLKSLNDAKLITPQDGIERAMLSKKAYVLF